MWCKLIKSVIFLENTGLLSNLGLLETTKSNVKKVFWFRPDKSELEKGEIGREQNNTALRVGKKQGVPEPFKLSLGH